MTNFTQAEITAFNQFQREYQAAVMEQTRIRMEFFWLVTEELEKPTEEKVKALMAKGKEIGIEPVLIETAIAGQLTNKRGGKKYLPLLKELEGT